MERADIFAHNLELIRRRWPDIARLVETADPLPADAVVESRSGEPTLRLAGEGGKPSWIHSRYDPVGEAQSQVDRLGLEPVDTVILFGVGLGYPLLALARNGFSTNFFVAIERHPGVMRAACERQPLDEFLAHPGALLMVGVDPDVLFHCLDDSVSRMFSGSVKLFAQPPSVRAFPGYYEKIVESVKDFVRHGTVTVRSALYLSRVSLQNRFRNLLQYVTSVNVASFRDRFRGRPAILVGAGPSLQNNIELLRRAKGRAVIIAVSTALKVLLGRGIRPDFTAIIDYHVISKRYFEGVCAEDAVPIVCDAKANTAAFDAYPGTRIFGNDLLMNSLLDGVPGDKGDLTGGATVAHAAFNIVSSFGCDPVILVGMDLSYPGGRHHVGGTAKQDQSFTETNRFYTFEMKEWEWYLAHRKQLLKVPGISGDEVWTSDVFFSYLREFEDMFARSDRRVIDATEGGALKKGTDVMCLEEALASFARTEIPPELFEFADPLDDEDRVREMHEKTAAALSRRIIDAGELDSIYRRCLRLLEKIVETTAGGVAADREVLRVIAHKESLSKFGFFYLMLNNLAQSDLRDRIHRDLGIAGGDVSGVQKQHRQAERDLEYIKGLRRALEFIVDNMREARSALKQIRRHRETVVRSS